MKIKKIFTSLIICAFLSFNTFCYAEKYVYPSGAAVGVELYTEGLLVVATEDIYENGKKYISPAESSGIKKGDIILTANGKKLNSNEDIASEVQGDNVELLIKRGEKESVVVVSPVITQGGGKIGVWLRDSTAGIGTVTYIDEENSTFAALGHGICDIDTGKLIQIRNGNIRDCSVASVKKSSKGNIGELECEFKAEEYGNIVGNSQCGIYGCLNNINKLKTGEAKKVDKPQEGEAVILAEVDGDGVEEYRASILQVSNTAELSKNIVLEITDERLIEKTGGIIQGMSGSPIIQDNKIVGAVTHVFVNNPTKGYGIFIENMIEEAENTR